tara:strand:- start:117 stop:365 length:249 start_codon:yes stop_codon:yes gene_type:complete
MTDINIAYNINYPGVSNKYKLTNNKGDCLNNFGNYFRTCSNISAQWGNSTETVDNDVSINGTPCHKLFNNSTKRKSVVYYER